MTSAATGIAASRSRRERTIVTPEGLALPIVLASRASRFGALVLDIVLLHLALLFTVLFLVWIGFELDFENRQTGEFLLVLFFLSIFVIRNFYFAFFELGPRGATPGKRLAGIRVAERGGGRLTAEAVIARNLLREIEIFVPTYWLLSSGLDQPMDWLALVWLLGMGFFLCFNKERMRAGDIIAGTWVVEAPRLKLSEVLSTNAASRGVSDNTGARYRFSDEELAVYGEHELQVLERVLREDRPDAIEQVAQTIAGKIGWNAGSGDERAFLDAYYAQLRARLERGMVFGQRKADKHS